MYRLGLRVFAEIVWIPDPDPSCAPWTLPYSHALTSFHFLYVISLDVPIVVTIVITQNTLKLQHSIVADRNAISIAYKTLFL